MGKFAIVDALKELIVSRGGNAHGIQTIEGAVQKLQAMEDANNPLSVLTIDATIGASVDLLGKYVADLQSDVSVGTHSISGKLKYVDDYTGFSGDPAEQVGHYLVLHASVPNVSDVAVTIKHSQKAGEKPLDMSDGILIFRVDESYMNEDLTLTFTATKTGYPAYSKTFDIKGLTLLPPAD